jgi:hypothetical protein
MIKTKGMLVMLNVSSSSLLLATYDSSINVDDNTNSQQPP